MTVAPKVTIKQDEAQMVAHALRFYSQHNPHLKRSHRWRAAMLANAVERRNTG